MNQHEPKPRTISCEAKRSLFAERERQTQRRRPLIWLGIAMCLILLSISALVFLLARPAVSKDESFGRIVSDAVEAPFAQKASGTDAGTLSVRAATTGHEPYPLIVR